MTAQAPARCRACSAELDADADRCRRCGAAQRVARCPHCDGESGVSPHPELRFVCDLCGGPRLPITDAKGAGPEVASLRKARAAAMARGGYRAAAAAGGALLAFDLLLFSLLLALFGAGFGLVLTGLLSLGAFGGFVAWSLQRANARGREIEPALDAAWLAAATDVAKRVQGQLTAPKLAAALGVGEPQSEELLALLEANDVVHGAMMSDFGPSPRVRISEPAPAPDVPDEQAAEDEALAAAEVSPERVQRVDSEKP